MISFWDERYSGSGYAYGEEPNEFLRNFLDRSAPGLALFPAEGEGRNAVYAARRGWEVHAFDISQEGQRKAGLLAERCGVNIDYRIINAEDFRASTHYQLIALIYAHFAQAVRESVFSGFIKALAPGGILLLEAFNCDQPGNSSGGPRDAALLYSTEMLAGLCRGLEIDSLHNARIELDEGPFHQGRADVVRLIARK